MNLLSPCEKERPDCEELGLRVSMDFVAVSVR